MCSVFRLAKTIHIPYVTICTYIWQVTVFLAEESYHTCSHIRCIITILADPQYMYIQCRAQVLSAKHEWATRVITNRLQSRLDLLAFSLESTIKG